MRADTKVEKKGLTSREFDELRRAISDVFFFASKCQVIHPQDGKVFFDLYPFQKTVLWHFLTKRFNIVLKFRQAGITELLSLYCLWFAMYHPNKNVIIISIKDRVARKVLRRIKFLYKSLPQHLKVSIVNGRPGENGTTTEMEFANGSTITSIPTTEEAGRSEACSLMVIDEAAIIRWATKIWAAAFPTLSTGGAAILNSTPYGVGNFFHKTWVDACAGGNTFNPIKLTWDMHPERDIKWYLEMRDALGLRRTAQEIDGDFLTSGYSVFDLTDIKAIEDSLSENVVIQTRFNGCLQIFKRPKRGEKYFIGADVATGRARDYSAFTIMNRTGEEYGCFKGKMPVSKFANLLGETGLTYNRALLAPESNDIGLAVTTKLQEDKYPNLYYSKRLLKEKDKNKPKEEMIPGWYTAVNNRSLIIDGLEQDIRFDNVHVKDPFFVQEAMTFIYDEKNRPIAMGKGGSGDIEDEEDDTTQIYTDDSILAKCITNHIRKGKINTRVRPPI